MSVQELRLAEKEAPKIFVLVQLFTKALREKKMLDSPCLFLVELLASNGEVMFCKSINAQIPAKAKYQPKRKVPIHYTDISRH
jgi:hypothetical protein